MRIMDIFKASSLVRYCSSSCISAVVLPLEERLFCAFQYLFSRHHYIFYIAGRAFSLFSTFSILLRLSRVSRYYYNNKNSVADDVFVRNEDLRRPLSLRTCTEIVFLLLDVLPEVVIVNHTPFIILFSTRFYTRKSLHHHHHHHHVGISLFSFVSEQRGTR